MLRWYLIETTIYPLGVFIKMIVCLPFYLCILYRWGVQEAFPPLYCVFLAAVCSRTWDTRRCRLPKGWLFGGSPSWVLLSAGFLYLRFPHWMAFFIRNPISAPSFLSHCFI